MFKIVDFTFRDEECDKRPFGEILQQENSKSSLEKFARLEAIHSFNNSDFCNLKETQKCQQVQFSEIHIRLTTYTTLGSIFKTLSNSNTPLEGLSHMAYTLK